MSQTKPIVIVGAGGNGRVILDSCQCAGLAVAGVLEPRLAAGSLVDDALVLGDDDRLDDPAFVADHAFVMGVAQPPIRDRLIARLAAIGGDLATVVHPAAAVSPRAILAGGCVVMAGAVINTGARLGVHTLVNTGASVDHDCVLGERVMVGPGARLAGEVACGDGANIGTGACLIPGVRVAPGAVVGAGAVVVRDVLRAETVIGVPAHPLARRP